MILLDLVQNLALLVALAAGYRMLSTRWEDRTLAYQVAAGLLFGTVALVGMMTPVHILPGLIFDGRSIIMAAAGLVGGPVVASVAGAMAAAYRIQLGGVGALMGVLVILEAGALGVALHIWRRRTGRTPGLLGLWAFGMAVHAVMAGLLLTTLPGPVRSVAWAEMGAAILLVYPLATMLICRLFLDYERRDHDRRALEESEARYRALWASVAHGVVASDAAGRVTLLNPMAEKLTGRSATEAVGAPVEEVVKLVDERTGGAIPLPLASSLGSTEPVPLPGGAVLVARDGTRRPVAGSCAPVSDPEGAAAGFALVFQDQTAEREARRGLLESRQRMALALEGAELGTWDWDLRTGVVVRDRRLLEMLGYEPGEIEPTPEGGERLIHPEDLPLVREALDAHLLGQRERFAVEHRLRHKSGRWVWVLDKGRVLERARDGTPLRVTGTHLDITERKEAEFERRAQRERLDRQNRLLLALMADRALYAGKLEEAVARLTEAGTSLLEADRGSFWWYGPGYASVRCQDAFSVDTRTHASGEEYPTAPLASYVEAHLAGEAVAARDARSDPRTQGQLVYLERHGIVSLLDIPVWSGERLTGILSFETTRAPRDWSKEDERLGLALSALVTVCLESAERARAEAEVRRRVQELEEAQAELRASFDEADRVRKALLSTLEDARRAEEALRESEAFTRLVMDNIPIGIAVNSVDPAVNFLYMNDNFPRLYRTTREALADPNAFWEAAYEDPVFREEIRARVLEDIASGDPARMVWEDVPITRAGQETTYISARNTPVLGRGLMISTVWDVTDRKRAEEALRESEERFRRLAENASDLIYRYRFVPEPGFEYVSPSATAMTGYTPEEHYADPALGFELIHPEDRGLLEAVAAGKVESDKPIVLQWVHKDGRAFWTEQRNVPIRDASGRLIAIEGIARDVTERVLAARELEQFKETLDRTLDCVFVFDAEELRFTYVNEGAARQVGYTREELLAMHPYDIKPEYPEPRFRELIAPLLADETPGLTFETVHRHKDGRLIPVEVALQLVTPLGGSPRFVAVVRDITDRRKREEELRVSEARYRELFKASPQILWVYDLETLAFLAVNDAAVEHYGYSREEFLGMTLADIRPPEDVPALLEDVARAREPVRDAGIWRHRKKDGTLIYVDIRSHALAWEGRPARLVLITDVTERLRQEAEIRELTERLEEKVRERTAQLEAANAELESFSYSVSHDLKAPLRAIDGYSALLEERADHELDEEGRRLVREVRANAQQMGRLIEDLLAFSRVGRVGMSQEAVDVASMIRELMERERWLAPQRRIEVEVGELPKVRGDATLLHQALDNVIANAVKFTRPRQVARIEVTGQSRGHEVEIAVRDNGVGFDPRYQHKLFRVFERLHYPDEFEGTGVGLAIVKRIVERHGGRVSAESEPGRGTTIRLWLPLAPEEGSS